MHSSDGRKLQKTPADLAEVTGARDTELALHLANQMISTLWLPESMTATEKDRRIAAAIKLLEGIQPDNELEGTLAVQMIATHEAAMECLRRAMAESTAHDGREQDLKYAAKLLGIFTQQLEALNRLRGKGQQKVTVEYVHVEAGAQAVVGNVDTRPTQDRFIASPSTRQTSPDDAVGAYAST